MSDATTGQTSVATRTEVNLVYAAGLVQGIVLVTFPAASTIFTDPDEYGLSSSQYGAMFLPQVVTAIAGSLLGSRLARRHGSKRVYLAGLMASLVSMGLLVASAPFATTRAWRYALAAAGHRVPRRRVRAHRADPQHAHRRVPPGGGRPVRPRAQRPPRLGTALAPIFVAIFVGLGFWWGLPVMSAVLLAGLLLASRPLPLHAGTDAPATQRRGRRSPAGSPCTPRSPCSTASARR